MTQNKSDKQTTRDEKVMLEIESKLDKNLNIEEYNSITNICREYTDVFHLKGEKLTSVPNTQHRVDLHADTKPINVRQYTQPYAMRQIINNEVDKMLQEGIVAHNNSPYNSPLLAVPKKPNEDGKPNWRIVVDFRKLNEATISDSYPLPLISDIFDQLGRLQYFSTLDMASGYHQIEMDPKDQHKTAFSTSHGHFEFLRMPFEMKNSQSTFQRMINNAMIGHLGVRCFVYLDDVIIYGRDLNDHNIKLKEILQVLRMNKLKIQTAKCCFLRKEIQFLGHIITTEGVMPNPKTIER